MAARCEASPDGKYKAVVYMHVDVRSREVRCCTVYRCEHCGRTATQYLAPNGRTWWERGSSGETTASARVGGGDEDAMP